MKAFITILRFWIDILFATLAMALSFLLTLLHKPETFIRFGIIKGGA